LAPITAFYVLYGSFVDGVDLFRGGALAGAIFVTGGALVDSAVRLRRDPLNARGRGQGLVAHSLVLLAALRLLASPLLLPRAVGWGDAIPLAVALASVWAICALLLKPR
jgi:hypothetical protein